MKTRFSLILLGVFGFICSVVVYSSGPGPDTCNTLGTDYTEREIASTTKVGSDSDGPLIAAASGSAHGPVDGTFRWKSNAAIRNSDPNIKGEWTLTSVPPHDPVPDDPDNAEKTVDVYEGITSEHKAMRSEQPFNNQNAIVEVEAIVAGCHINGYPLNEGSLYALPTHTACAHLDWSDNEDQGDGNGNNGGSGNNGDGGDPANPSPVSPPPSYHACGVHLTSVSGDHSWGTAPCGDDTHIGYLCQINASDHEWVYETCSSLHARYECDGTDHSWVSFCFETDSNGQSCVTSGGYYACSPHTHTYPPSLVACGGASYTGCSGATSRTEHHVPSCGNCNNPYWTCSQYAYRHTDEATCRRPGCGVTFYRCNNGTCTSNWGTRSSHWAQ